MQSAKCVFLSLIFFCDTSGYSGGVRTIHANESEMIDINVSPKGTIISFVVKPSKVILGEEGSFSLEYVERDIAVSPLTSLSSSNLCVYLLGRRYGFRLHTKTHSGDEVVIVKDKSESGRTP